MAGLVLWIIRGLVHVCIMVRVPHLRIVARDIIKMAVFAPRVRMVGQHQDIRIQGLVRVICPQAHLCRIRQEHIHAVQMRIMPADKNPACAGFFMRCFLYRNPLARQHADAAAFQSEYCFDGLRKSRHGCQLLHFLFVPVPVHLA